MSKKGFFHLNKIISPLGDRHKRSPATVVDKGGEHRTIQVIEAVSAWGDDGVVPQRARLLIGWLGTCIAMIPYLLS